MVFKSITWFRLDYQASPLCKVTFVAFVIYTYFVGKFFGTLYFIFHQTQFIFVSIWTHFLFYSKGYNLWVSFILMFKFVLDIITRDPSSWLFCPFDMYLSSLQLCFLAQQNIPGWSCTFSPSALESATSPRSVVFSRVAALQRPCSGPEVRPRLWECHFL